MLIFNYDCLHFNMQMISITQYAPYLFYWMKMIGYLRITPLRPLGLRSGAQKVRIMDLMTMDNFGYKICDENLCNST